MPFDTRKSLTDAQRRRALRWIIIGQAVLVVLIFVGVLMERWMAPLLDTVMGP